MSNSGLEKWVWVLIYGGLLVVSLGLFVKRADPSFGWTLVAAGAFITVAGAVLVYLRAGRPADGKAEGE